MNFMLFIVRVHIKIFLFCLLCLVTSWVSPVSRKSSSLCWPCRNLGNVLSRHIQDGCCDCFWGSARGTAPSTAVIMGAIHHKLHPVLQGKCFQFKVIALIIIWLSTLHSCMLLAGGFVDNPSKTCYLDSTINLWYHCMVTTPYPTPSSKY